MPWESVASFLIGLAGLGVIAALLQAGLGKRWRAHRAHEADRRLPGRTPQLPHRVPDYRAVDDKASAATCPVCGIKLKVTGEGSRAREGERLRVVRFACPRCRVESAWFFQVGGEQ